MVSVVKRVRARKPVTDLEWWTHRRDSMLVLVDDMQDVTSKAQEVLEHADARVRELEAEDA